MREILRIMDSLWVGSDVDLSVLRRCRTADRLEYRLECLHKARTKHCDFADKVCGDDGAKDKFDEEGTQFRRRRRSGTWP